MDNLKPGGFIIFEAYSKQQIHYQRTNPKAGGPKDIDSLFNIDEIKHDFQEIEFIYLNEEEVELQEGEYHSGKGMVIRFLGKKKEAS